MAALMAKRRCAETEEEKDRRLEKQNQINDKRRSEESEEQKKMRLEKQKQIRSEESKEQKKLRLQKLKRSSKKRLAKESEEQINLRLKKQKKIDDERRMEETEKEKNQRLEMIRRKRRLNVLSIQNFEKEIWSFARSVCEVCLKCLYDKQCKVVQGTEIKAGHVLPDCLQREMIACHRCWSKLKIGKVPSVAYWNKMEPSEIPDHILDLTEMETRLLSRITPFLKIIKVGGRFSQKWLKGQATLFAQDIEEITEQLPRHLGSAGIVIVSETLQNVLSNRDFQIDLGRLLRGLQWLKNNNPLYFSIEVDLPAQPYDISQIVVIQGQEPSNCNEETDVHISDWRTFPECRVLRASFHQGASVFPQRSRGMQCTAMSAAAAAFAFLTHVADWKQNHLNRVLITGDRLYTVSAERANRSGYLLPTEVIAHVPIGEKTVVLCDIGNEERLICGPVDVENDDPYFPCLSKGLETLLTTYDAGILTCNSVSVALGKQGRSYWLFNSHSTGPKGFPAQSGNGTASVILVETFAALRARVRNIIRHPDPPVYTLTPLVFAEQTSNESVEVTERSHAVTQLAHVSSLTNSVMEPTKTKDTAQAVAVPDPSVQRGVQPITTTTTSLICATSMLMNVDDDVPMIDTVLDSTNINNVGVSKVQLKRKTAPPVSCEKEKRAEELAWFSLFPTGCNGLEEQREVPITALDYFQTRVMSADKRFQRTDYLFYALSTMEYYKIKQSIGVSCRMRQGGLVPEGLVDNIHLTIRSLRGTGAYWRRTCSDLIAKVRNLGPPSWFVTFSCNDLNWEDMTKAFLIADGRSNEDSSTIPFDERMSLVEKYPVVLSRQFMVRVYAIMRYLKANDTLLGGKVVDWWWRVEFQNRGSPHLHMLLWCENLPSFDSPHGVKLVDEVVVCSRSTENKRLVEQLQIHKHTETCFKNRQVRQCRFGFPRPLSEETKMLTEDEAVCNKNRYYVLKRQEGEEMVNNYNPTLLQLWKGNMDIQPCGNVTAVAYYIAKYATKNEPTDTCDSVKQAIRGAKQSNLPVSMQLFVVSMAILKKRLVSASECAFRLCHLPLKDSSRKVVFLNTCKPEERYRMMNLVTNDVFSNIFDKYENRPEELNYISLAEFAVNYEVQSGKMFSDEDGDEELRDVHTTPTRYITLQNGVRMKIRNTSAVLRTRYFTQTSDREGYFYSLLVCHVPFRSERDLLLPGETAEQAFARLQGALRPLRPDVDMNQFRYIEQELNRVIAQLAAFDYLQNRPEEGPFIENDVVLPDADLDCDPVPDIVEFDETALNEQITLLNAVQRQLFDAITTTITNEISGNVSTQTLLFATGGAGSGKSFVLKLLVSQITRCYLPTVDPLIQPKFVEVAALTGVAARQIHGRTLHSLFALSIEKGRACPYRPLSGNRLEMERRRWRYIRWLIIDEISMVSYEVLRAIHLRLQQFRDNSLPFGGVHILVFGDILQLPPVLGSWCFRQPAQYSHEPHLWRLFGFCELMTNMRQRGDSEFTDLLNNLRVGELTLTQLDLLLERSWVPLEGVFDKESAIRIFPTVKMVEEFNQEMCKALRKSNVKMYTINAVDRSREPAKFDHRPEDKYIPKDPNNCGGLLHSITLGVNARVMLRRNIDVKQGLVNGSMGVVRGFIWPSLRRDQLEPGELPAALLIEFDDKTVGSALATEEGYVKISPVNTTYDGIKGYGKIEREMLPVILSWAVTVHKLQGVTLERAVVDLSKKIFAKGQAYVALSRVKSLQGLAISSIDPNKLLNHPHDKDAMAELIRLRETTHK